METVQPLLSLLSMSPSPVPVPPQCVHVCSDIILFSQSNSCIFMWINFMTTHRNRWRIWFQFCSELLWYGTKNVGQLVMTTLDWMGQSSGPFSAIEKKTSLFYSYFPKNSINQQLEFFRIVKSICVTQYRPKKRKKLKTNDAEKKAQVLMLSINLKIIQSEIMHVR